MGSDDAKGIGSGLIAPDASEGHDCGLRQEPDDSAKVLHAAGQPPRVAEDYVK